MISHPRSFRPILALLTILSSLAQSGCDRPAVPPAPAPVVVGAAPAAAPLEDLIPPKELDAVIRAHFRGLGLMEQYQYGKASAAFREVHEHAPGWIPGSVNLAIALLNDTGAQAEATKAAGGTGFANFDEALALLNGVIDRDPKNLNARYCRGLILEFLGEGNTVKAHSDFKFVAENDPADAHAWFKVGATLTVPDDPRQPAGPEQAEELISLYTKALDRNPYLVAAFYKLQQVYGWARQREKQAELIRQWQQLNPDQNPSAPGDSVGAYYGESGKYSRILNPFPSTKPVAEPPSPARFEASRPIQVSLPAGVRWARSEDFQESLAPLGQARARFGATSVVFDANGDGQADLFLAAALVGPNGLRDALLLNLGEGQFEEVSETWGLAQGSPSLACAAADFDADRRVDLFVTGLEGNRLLRNLGKTFEDVTKTAGVADTGALGLNARWLDIDQDGDLDLYVLQHTTREAARGAFRADKSTLPKVINAAYRNVGKPSAVKGRPQDNWAPIAVAPPDLPAREGLSIAFVPWPEAPELLGPPAHYTGLAALDIDDDRDLDLVLASDEGAPLVVLNDRLGKFHGEPLELLTPAGPVSGVLITDLDKDGRSDLVFTLPEGRLAAWRNAVDRSVSPAKLGWEPWASDATGWRQAQAADLDLDTWPDLIGLPAPTGEPRISWARNDGGRFETLPIDHGPGIPEASRIVGSQFADLLGNAVPDLILIPEGSTPLIAKNLGNGRSWIALDLGGRWKTSFDRMRTNPHGLGTRLSLEGQGLQVTQEHTTPSTGLGQSVTPIVLGLGDSRTVELIRLRWPDGTMQCELNEKAETKVALAEYNRKSGSCPVLFTWNGSRFECLGDFLGGGGLGYLVAPGVYSQPDRDESVAIQGNQLQAVDGVFRLSVTEPMDEVAYLDRLELLAVDAPPGITTSLDERFAPDGPRPTGDVIAWKSTFRPLKATDLDGVDLTRTLQTWDRETADGFKLLNGWTGYAEEHGIVLDFGDQLSRFGPTDPLLLVLAGWVEYPYSQTNYAAATAGVVLTPPAVERRNDDGTWTVVEPNAGYPAGLPRMMTLDLSGKLNGPSCVIRLRTNMECYYDQAFVALRDPRSEDSLKRTTLPVARAVLGRRGYTREVSPDGKLPLLYDYDYVDPAPLARMQGRLTRLGDVAELLRADDDRFCLVGPGDEVRVEFDEEGLPRLPEGWTRSYVLKSVGYCKDADPLTALSDTVEPLPWKGMPPFPFEETSRRPSDPGHDGYLKDYQTRPAGGP